MTKWITVEECLAGREIAVQRERELIIKILEDVRAVGDDPLTNLYLDTTSLIAVIKGENK